MNPFWLSVICLLIGCLNPFISQDVSAFFSDWSKWILLSAGLLAFQKRIRWEEAAILLIGLAPSFISMAAMPLLLLIYLALSKEKIESLDYVAIASVALSACFGWAALSISDVNVKQIAELVAVVSLLFGSALIPNRKLMFLSALLMVPNVSWTLDIEIVAAVLSAAIISSVFIKKARVSTLLVFLVLLGFVVLHSGARWSLVAAPFLFLDGLQIKANRKWSLFFLFPIFVAAFLLKVDPLETFQGVLLAAFAFNFGADVPAPKENIALSVLGLTGFYFVFYNPNLDVSDDLWIAIALWTTSAALVYFGLQFWMGNKINERLIEIRQKISVFSVAPALIRGQKKFFEFLGRTEWI